MRKTASEGKKKSAPAKDVDSYLAALPIEARVTLQKLRETIKAAAPNAEEVISYRMPAYRYHGALVFFAAFKNRCSLFVASHSILGRLGKELAPYHTSGTTIHFTPEHPLPASLVRKVVKLRLKENEDKAKNK